MKLIIDIPYEAYYTFKCDLGKGNLNALAEIVANGKLYEERPPMIKINDEELDREDILKSVHLLDIFTKTYCRYRNDYERFDDLTFRCDECPFQEENGNCLCKVFKYKYAPDYKDFGAMGDL